MRIYFSPLAEDDLEAIADYIARDNPKRALSFVRELRLQCEKIAQNPMGYQLRTEIGKHVRTSVYQRYVLYF
jgi:toxin ParE1/3/4